MQIALETARQHARACARAEACTTAEIAARALGCSPDEARSALRMLADGGYLRASLLSGFGNKLYYQPTPRAASFEGTSVPKFLRAGLGADARLRGALRGYVRFAARPELAYLSTTEQSELCRDGGIAERGYARALLGREGTHTHIFAPILPNERPIAAIEGAAFRWLPLLETGTATLHFLALAGASTAGVREALATLTPCTEASDFLAELAALDAEIAADRSGLVALRSTARRAALVAEIEATHDSEAQGYRWLGACVEVQL